MVIYEIKNVVANKKYIGQTTQNVEQRWREHRTKLRQNRHGNPHLQNSWNKYGEEAFQFGVLETAETIDNLNFLEKKYVSLFGDYNLRTGGDNFRHANETKKKISETRKARNIPSPTKGMIFDRTDAQRDASAKLRKPDGYPNLISPDGNVVKIVNVKRFAKENGLWYSGVQAIINEEYKTYRGWRLESTPFSDTDRAKNISRSKRNKEFPQVISPDGNTYRIEVLRRFCRKHNLSPSNMSLLVNEKKNSYKGWTLIKEDY